MVELLPTFLVIGAMKAGTTSLCRDLSGSPGIYFPTVKEPHTLCFDTVETPAGRRRYASFFRTARSDQQRGEGSTGYTKRPGIEGVAERARRVLNADLRLVYIVREPIDRIVSHHRHLVRGGDAPPDINEALRTHPELIDVSRYAMQLDPWIEQFGLDQIHILRFETYCEDRRGVVAEVCRFLGAPPPPAGVDFEQVHNASGDALVPPRGLRNLTRGITRSQFYKRVVHPRTPPWVRNRFKAAVYQRQEENLLPLTPESVATLLRRLSPDIERFHAMLGWPRSIWNSRDMRHQYGRTEQ